jgi:hypothetical protein
MTLPSGLPKAVNDDEFISRFLTSRSHFNRIAVKQAAFIPNRNNGKLSVVRHSAQPIKESREIAIKDFGLQKVYGPGVVTAAQIRGEGLDLDADDEPPKHADIIGWPWSEEDPQLLKSEQKLKAIV